MSDDQMAGFKRLMEIYGSTLRLLGAANATGMLAAGAAYNAFEKIAPAQAFTKLIVMIFLFGVAMFAVSYTALFFSQVDMEHYFIGSRELTAWEKIFLRMRKTADQHLAAAKRYFIIVVLAGMVSMVAFLAGVALTSTLVAGL